MAGGMELAGVFGSGATVHGLMNREHRERDGKQANSSRPRAQPVVAVGVGAAMAGGESSRAHVKRGLRAMKHANNNTGRKRRARRSSLR